MADATADKSRTQVQQKMGDQEAKELKLTSEHLLRLDRFMEEFDREKLLKLPQEFLQNLKMPFVGRDEEALVAALALITGEHAIFIGPPGTAKSAVAIRAAKLIRAKYFEIHLDRHMEKEELVGARDIEKLKRGDMARVMENMLPKSEIAFVDETFAGRGGVLVVLNPVLNERKFKDSGKIINTPILSVFGATNEIPDIDEKLDAFYARFLFRQYVGPVIPDDQEDMISKAQRGRQAKRIHRALQAMYEYATGKNYSEVGDTDVVRWVAANKDELLLIFTKRGFNSEACKDAIEAYLDTDVKPVMSVDQLKFLGQLLSEVDTSKVQEKMIILFQKIKDEIKVDLYDRTKGMVPDAIKAMALLNYERIEKNGGKIIAEEEDLLALQYIAPIQKEDFEKVRVLLSKELNTTQKNMETIEELLQNLKDSRGDMKVLTTQQLEQLLLEHDTTKRAVTKMMKDSGSKTVIEAGKSYKKESDDLRKELIEELKLRIGAKDWEENANDLATVKSIFHNLRASLAPKFEQTAMEAQDPDEIVRAHNVRMQILDLADFIMAKSDEAVKSRDEKNNESAKAAKSNDQKDSGETN